MLPKSDSERHPSNPFPTHGCHCGLRQQSSSARGLGRLPRLRPRSGRRDAPRLGCGERRLCRRRCRLGRRLLRRRGLLLLFCRCHSRSLRLSLPARLRCRLLARRVAGELLALAALLVERGQRADRDGRAREGAARRPVLVLLLTCAASLWALAVKTRLRTLNLVPPPGELRL